RCMSLLFFPCALFSCFLPPLRLVWLCTTTVRVDYSIVRPLHPLPGLRWCSVSSTPRTTSPSPTLSISLDSSPFAWWKRTQARL
ncbi:hypothetical protein B0H13DRAFT_2022026, partial [Mycena leptocephala]